jgi:phage protein D
MKPTFRLFADAKGAKDYAAEVTARIMDRFMSLTLTDESGLKSDALEIVLDDRAPYIPTPRKGVELRLALGYAETGVMDMGLFVVDEVDLVGPPSRMVIRAKAVSLEDSETVSALTANLKTQRSRSWHGVTLGQIVATIAKEAGYSPKIDDELAGIQITHLDQTAESDMNFLSRVAVDFDALFKLAGSNLLFLRRDATSSEAARVLVHGPFSDQNTNDTASDWSLNLPEREAFGRVVATYHDQDAAELVEVVAGKDGPIKMLDDPRPDKRSASRAAVAELIRIRRAKGTGSVSVSGNPLLMAETVVLLEGFRADLNGEWLVEKATHTLDGDGYQTKVDFKVKGADDE